MDKQNQRDYSRRWLWTTNLAMSVAFYEAARAVYLSANGQNLPIVEGIVGVGATLLAFKAIDNVRQNNITSALEDIAKIAKDGNSK